MAYPTFHLATVAGTAFAVYFLWSMILDPTTGPLPGLVLPLAVGVVGFLGSLLVASWGVKRIYR